MFACVPFTSGMSPLQFPYVYDLFAPLIFFIPFWLLWTVSKGTWIGFGDAKLAIAIGALLGFVSGLSALVLAIFGLVQWCVSHLWLLNVSCQDVFGGLTAKSEIPLAPVFNPRCVYCVVYTCWCVRHCRILWSIKANSSGPFLAECHIQVSWKAFFKKIMIVRDLLWSSYSCHWASLWLSVDWLFWNGRGFSDKLLAQTSAEDISLAIRQTQAYGISVRETGTNTGQFNSAYGIDFDLTNPT